MTSEGIFHDAHEVYIRSTALDAWEWVATFSTSDRAKSYALTCTAPDGSGRPALTEVRPV